MFDRILVPLDGSAAAEAILPHVRALWRKTRADLLLLRAIDLPWPGDIYAPAAVAELEKEAQAYLRGIETRLRAEDIPARTRTVVGHAAEEILRTGEREKSSLIALTTHGYGGVGQWAYGSVAGKILHSSPLPLLMVRTPPPPAEPRPPGEFRNLLVPIDGSELSLQIVAPVCAFAKLYGARVTLLLVNVLEEDLLAPKEFERARVALEEACRRFTTMGVPTETLTGRGHPASEILLLAGRVSADLIAMTTHGRSGIRRWMLGSVTEKVLRGTVLPMLVVRNRPA